MQKNLTWMSFILSILSMTWRPMPYFITFKLVEGLQMGIILYYHLKDSINLKLLLLE